ncbi:MAG TPA: tRNA pseudouridine(55) synthase TruB [Gemmatimonadales bacterium]|nr:tRNA pseudouridine(55) synthase TruB [Gemmatimonadales bacterium]
MDKPAGLTSHAAVQRVRRALRTRQAGHTGTLDPFATGLLIVLVGRATRLARFVEGERKTYLATARLGVRTDTDDLTGAVLEEAPLQGLSEEQVRAALARFAGESRQRPPVYSAKHVGGERSHRLARRGAAVEPPETSITVHRIEPVAWEPPSLTFRATVSAGTYLRAIARDLGARLGVGAHLTALRREAIGDLRVEDAVPLDEVGPEALLAPTCVLRHLPAVELDAAARLAVVHGRPVAAAIDGPAEGDVPEQGGGPVVLLSGAELVAVARPVEGWLRPTVVLARP